MCGPMVGSYEESLDVTQEVFVQVLESLSTFRGESKFSTWLYSVTANYCRNYRRKMRRVNTEPLVRTVDGKEREMVLIDGRENVEDRVITDEMISIMLEEIAKLPDDYREILHLRDVEGFTYDEISEQLGIALSNVKVRIHRGREMLKKRLERRGLL